jgi:signal transduction histidine kinase
MSSNPLRHRGIRLALGEQGGVMFAPWVRVCRAMKSGYLDSSSKFAPASKSPIFWGTRTQAAKPAGDACAQGEGSELCCAVRLCRVRSTHRRAFALKRRSAARNFGLSNCPDQMEVDTTDTLSTQHLPLSCTAQSLAVNRAANEEIEGASLKTYAGESNTTARDDSRKNSMILRVLMVEDDPADVELVLLTLKRDGFDVSCDVAQTVEEFTLRIQTMGYDIVLVDYNLTEWRGTEAMDILRRENLDVPLIVVTGYLSQEKAMDCIKQGATDCVLKDHLARLPASVRRALEEKGLRDQRRQFEMDLANKVVELARSNAELEQFAYLASHDLQEPLRMIANYTQLLAERYRGQLDEQADKYIAYSVDGAVRMQALIQDLLKFARVGKAEIEPRSTACDKVVEQALENLQVAVRESGAVVHWNGLPVVMADPSQLTQVFQNLIANAIKFHGSATPLVQISAEKKGQEWVLAVSDNGIGIPPESWQDIFVIFRRLHTRAQYAGNGIGLAICKKIIERHGGRLWLEGQTEPGSCFKFTLSSGPSSKAIQGAQA